MKCPNCHREMSDHAAYCSKCGHPLLQLTCPVCHASVESGMNFCGECGAALNSNTEFVAVQTAEKPEKSKQEKKAKKSKPPKEEETGKRKGKRPFLRKVIFAVLALVVVAGGVAGLLLSGVLPLHKKPSAVSEYVIRYDNGDTVYSQGTDHLAIDEDTYLIYYDNLLMAFTLTDLSSADADALAEQVGGTVVGDISGCINVLQIMVQNADLETLNAYADILMASDDVLYASYDMPMTIDTTDDNPWSDDGTEIAGKGDESNPDGNDWWAEAIGAYTAWEIVDSLSDSNALSDIIIGIMDDGFDTDHADLAGKITVLNDNSEEDHGTHVAGIIGAANNDIGIRGIADNATLLAVDFSQTTTADDGTKSTSNILVTEEWIELNKQLIEDGNAAVINNSYGLSISFFETLKDIILDEIEGSLSENDKLNKLLDSIETILEALDYKDYGDAVEEAVQNTAEMTLTMMYVLYQDGYLGEKTDVLFVQAAGNGYKANWDGLEYSLIGCDATLSGYYCSITEERFHQWEENVQTHDDSFDYELVKNHILIVGAVENEQEENGEYKMTDFSSYGSTVNICAPGQAIYSTITDDEYENKLGTSMSAPMVSAAAALVWSINPDLTAGEVKDILISTAGVAVGVTGGDAGNTYPMLNVGSAVIRAAAGTITGTVVDGETGEVITGVICTLTTDASNSAFFTTPTISGADDGSFTVSGIGNCTVLLEKDGYNPVELTVSVDLREDVDVGEITMTATCSGTVIDAADSSVPIVGAMITVTDMDGTVTAEATTDETGAFAIRLSLGTYIIQVEMEGYQSVSSEITIAAGESTGILISMSAEVTDGDMLRAKLNELNITEDVFEWNNHYYLFFDESYSWSDAESYCESLGGHLVTITSQEEQDAVYSYVSAIAGDEDIFIGLTDEENEGDWSTWVTGEVVGYTNWGENEPDNRGGQAYGVLCTGYRGYKGGSYYIMPGQWDDNFTSSSTAHFICEWD